MVFPLTGRANTLLLALGFQGRSEPVPAVSMALSCCASRRQKLIGFPPAWMTPLPSGLTAAETSAYVDIHGTQALLRKRHPRLAAALAPRRTGRSLRATAHRVGQG